MYKKHGALFVGVCLIIGSFISAKNYIEYKRPQLSEVPGVIIPHLQHFVPTLPFGMPGLIPIQQNQRGMPALENRPPMRLWHPVYGAPLPRLVAMVHVYHS